MTHAALGILFIWYLSELGRGTIPKEPLTISLFSDELETSFVRSDLMQEAETPPEDTKRISDRDTLMLGEQNRADVDASDQSGVEQDILVMRDLPESPQIEGSAGKQPSKANPISDLTVNADGEKGEAGSDESIDPQSNGLSQQMPEVTLPDSSAPFQSLNNEEAPSKNRKEMLQVPVVRGRAAPSAPASSMSFQEQKTRLEGRSPDVGASSWDARATLLGEYQAEVYRRVGENWHRMIRERRSLITYGRAMISVEIASSGRVMGLSLREWPERGTMLGVVSEASVRRAAPFVPFPDGLRRQIGDSMRLDLTFVVY